jgi:hypothetical protein
MQVVFRDASTPFRRKEVAPQARGDASGEAHRTAFPFPSWEGGTRAAGLRIPHRYADPTHQAVT